MQRTLDSPSTSGNESSSRLRSTQPTGNKTGGWSTVFKPIEVENVTECSGLKVDLTESFITREDFDVQHFLKFENIV